MDHMVLDAKAETTCSTQPVYFGEYRPKRDPRGMARLLQRQLEQTNREMLTRLAPPSTVVSEMIAWAAKNAANTELCLPDQDVIALINASRDLLADTADSMAFAAAKKKKRPADPIEKKLDLKHGREAPELSAVSQQLARDIFNLGEDKQSPGAQSYLYALKVLGALAANRVMVGSEGIKLINGARAEAAVIHFFEDIGFLPLTPNPINLTEIRAWDTIAGIDLAAVSPNMDRIFLVDCKADSGYLTGGGALQESHLLRVDWTKAYGRKLEYQQLVLSDIEWYLQAMGRPVFQSKPPEVSRVIIQLPTNELHVSPFGRILDDTMVRELADKLGIIISEPSRFAKKVDKYAIITS